ncbi:uncharacterized protein GGS22DRAFT_46646 [Annulohypoxylon maeteangense]|uniref:uncharacterized protein n=1 Tax=Annulohypoxylon maeteangense TaxID=1927788 RepID=UPI00200887AC|nr:uncharacterized protein GGS22DRAFT_46646 [Annulohypoxylon maeteangense]KAI0882590.1 hypothetical protein GGS22DRAFT_46646 [Annulohypoxylon maeteangense]
MKTTSFFSPLSTILLLGAIYPTYAAVLPRDDASTITNFGRIGICMSYLGAGPLDKELAPCKTWCPTQNANQDPNAVGCQGPNIPQDQLDPSTIEKDDDGNLWTSGTCVCDLPLAGAIIDVVIQGLSKLDNVICAVMLSAVVTLVEEGIDKVPGGSSVQAVQKAVEGAKTFIENGLDAVSFFGDWIGKSCGVSDFNFNLDDIFDGLSGEPDSLGESKGCFKANKMCTKP